MADAGRTAADGLGRRWSSRHWLPRRNMAAAVFGNQYIKKQISFPGPFQPRKLTLIEKDCHTELLLDLLVVVPTRRRPLDLLCPRSDPREESKYYSLSTTWLIYEGEQENREGKRTHLK